jgi:hypothetical protein
MEAKGKWDRIMGSWRNEGQDSEAIVELSCKQYNQIFAERKITWKLREISIYVGS